LQEVSCRRCLCSSWMQRCSGARAAEPCGCSPGKVAQAAFHRPHKLVSPNLLDKGGWWGGKTQSYLCPARAGAATVGDILIILPRSGESISRGTQQEHGAAGATTQREAWGSLPPLWRQNPGRQVQPFPLPEGGCSAVLRPEEGSAEELSAAALLKASEVHLQVSIDFER